MTSSGSWTKGVLFALPWIIGMCVFTLYPFFASLYYSFTSYSVLQPPEFVGMDNFKEMANDTVFWKTMTNTFTYALMAIPSGLFLSLVLALVINGLRRGQIFYSVVFYLPHLMPAVATALLWMWIFNAELGLLNGAIRPFFNTMNDIRVWLDPALAAQIQADSKMAWGPPAWLTSTTWAMPSLVIMALWGVGHSAFIYLAKLQDVPVELYEAAELDGASTWQKIRHVTIPMISPIILFNAIMSIIGAFQIFAGPYIMTKGGPARATYFLPQYIFENAFLYLNMGYACAMGWVLFIAILVLTLFAFWWSKDKVYYAGK